jgi:hypothetical protein
MRKSYIRYCCLPSVKIRTLPVVLCSTLTKVPGAFFIIAPWANGDAWADGLVAVQPRGDRAKSVTVAIAATAPEFVQNLAVIL